jgi:hypothetical protein
MEANMTDANILTFDNIETIEELESKIAPDSGIAPLDSPFKR